MKLMVDDVKKKSCFLFCNLIKCSTTLPEKAPLVPPPDSTGAIIRYNFIPN